MMNQLQGIFREALVGLLSPVIRFAVRRSIKFQDFVECAKSVFIKIAGEEIGALDEQVTTSKISAVTGIQRREVKRIVDEKPQEARVLDLITRVIGMWQSSDRFRTKDGRPRVLSFHSREGEFAELVATASTDLNPYTVLFELERAGVARNTDDGVKLIKPAYQPKGDIQRALQMLVEDSSDLHEAVDQNIFHQQKDQNLHIKTEYDNISPDDLSIVRNWFLKHGAVFHEDARQFLAKLDRDTNPQSKNSQGDRRIRATIGTFSLTQEFAGEKVSTGSAKRKPTAKKL